MAEVFVALGSNLGDPACHMREALQRLAQDLAVDRVSSLYRTEPVGFREQPDFLNAVASAHTQKSPTEVLALLVEIESAMGRRRDVPLGPRTIDLDLLLYDGVVVAERDLTLPHPRMAERRFVLEPLAEIAPDLRPPGLGTTIRELLARLPGSASVERLDAADWPPPLPPG
jgi:2-amino-4-hydroxy-6-hydroxymethyldihydropteridine diphosphokinase